MEASRGMRAIIEAIQSNQRVTGKSGMAHRLHSSIDPEEGLFLERLIKSDPNVKRTLEVGCAYGLSSLHICNGLHGRPNARHTILDPFQNSQWDGAGIRNLEEAGVDYFEWIEELSEIALPRLLADREGGYDMVFVDGWHTLDHTLLDCFYATRLLRTGGYLVVDDIILPPVRRAISYVLQYPCYKAAEILSGKESPTPRLRCIRALLSALPADIRRSLLHPDLEHRVFGDRTVRMVALQKVSADTRNWDWYPANF
jgi:predicted O-methyltransferase YrrM